MGFKLRERIRIAIILILGMMALGLLTWGIGKLYLEFVGQSSRAKVESAHNILKEVNPLKETVLVLPEAKFWICQVGVFQNESNARSTKAQLQGLNFPADVISLSPWVVGIGLGHTANDLKGIRGSLAEKGISTVPKLIVLPQRSFRVTGNGSQLTVEVLTNINTILREGVTAEALAQEKQVWDTQAGDNPPKDLEALHQLYNLVREKTTPEMQKTLGLSLYCESQRVINKFLRK